VLRDVAVRGVHHVVMFADFVLSHAPPSPFGTGTSSRGHALFPFSAFASSFFFLFRAVPPREKDIGKGQFEKSALTANGYGWTQMDTNGH
jgi:hypothetical protein